MVTIELVSSHLPCTCRLRHDYLTSGCSVILQVFAELINKAGFGSLGIIVMPACICKLLPRIVIGCLQFRRLPFSPLANFSACGCSVHY